MQVLRLTNWMIVVSWRALMVMVGAGGRLFLSMTSMIALVRRPGATRMRDVMGWVKSLRCLPQTLQVLRFRLPGSGSRPAPE